MNSSQGGGFKDTWVLASDEFQQKAALTRERVRTEIGRKNYRSLAHVTASKVRKLILVGKIYRAGIYHFERIFFLFTIGLWIPILMLFGLLLARSIYLKTSKISMRLFRTSIRQNQSRFGSQCHYFCIL